jgi:hypothetical protein
MPAFSRKDAEGAKEFYLMPEKTSDAKPMIGSKHEFTQIKFV